jgi:hypothetical protein
VDGWYRCGWARLRGSPPMLLAIAQRAAYSVQFLRDRTTSRRPLIESPVGFGFG